MQPNPSRNSLLKALGFLFFIVVFWKITKGVILTALVAAIVWIIYKLIRGDFI